MTRYFLKVVSRTGMLISRDSNALRCKPTANRPEWNQRVARRAVNHFPGVSEMAATT
jgi:hypothetical protein